MVKRRSVQPRWLLLAWSAFLLCVTEAAFAEEASAERRGLIFVREYCSECHAIGKAGGSRLANAAPFRALRLRYPVADLQRPLLEGIHPAMPRITPAPRNPTPATMPWITRLASVPGPPRGSTERPRPSRGIRGQACAPQSACRVDRG